jgi:hypothetical protein
LKALMFGTAGDPGAVLLLEEIDKVMAPSDEVLFQMLLVRSTLLICTWFVAATATRKLYLPVPVRRELE